ncbi:ATP-binding protein [Streptomyces sp. 15-116A]|uniref:ATP-binding protein n=1 Tax=Streptomyces sp. 15-116A TaxID=2259035 RepID=UPI0021B35CAE|nr:ATP-binding protein [Streptomyces sp. 15-116A]MCT7352549.1 ATP-binding protein [Streptomyces sp. 15-116A]
MASVQLPYARVLLLPAILMAAATGAAVALVTEPARIAVGVCGAVATLLVIAASAEAVRRGRVLRDARTEYERHRAYLEARVAAHDTETRHFTDEVFPAALDHMHRGNEVEEVLRALPRLNPAWRNLPQYQLDLLKKLLGIIDHEESLRDSNQRSFVSIARRVQSIVHQQAEELREMEEDHGRNPEVFDDLLRIDHGNALIGRLADSISVLGGGRPGRQWPLPVALYSVLRGAMSRILEYRRIDLKSIAKVNVKGISVEPVIHAVAELLDNATRYSPPQSKVHVTAIEVQTGVAIEIEDAGVNFDERARARLEGLVEQAMQGNDIQEIGANPRLGLSVVGRLCAQYKMQIALRASAYGGVRAVLVVPKDMLTDEPGVGLAHGIGATSVPNPVDMLPGPKRAPKKRRPTSPRIPETVSMEDDVPEVTEWTAGGLPQRRSKVKTPMHQRYADMAAIEREQREAAARGEKSVWSQAVPEPEPEKKQEEKREPGLWIDSFWEGLKEGLEPGVHPTDFTRNPTAYLHLINEPARTEADDEGDLK